MTPSNAQESPKKNSKIRAADRGRNLPGSPMWPSPKPRIFLDSNVIFYGMYSSEKSTGVILERFIDGRLKVVISQQVLE